MSSAFFFNIPLYKFWLRADAAIRRYESEELMDAASNALERIITAADNLRFLISKSEVEALKDDEKENLSKVSDFVKKYEEAMEDDFNTADGISAIFEIVKLANQTASGESSKAYLKEVLETIEKLCDVLGIFTEKQVAEGAISEEEILAKIEERAEAKKAKDFARADAIRDELLAAGVEIKDTREGVKWTRV